MFSEIEIFYEKIKCILIYCNILLNKHALPPQALLKYRQEMNVYLTLTLTFTDSADYFDSTLETNLKPFP